MSSKFVYSETIPAEILPAIKEKLAKYENLIPGWAQEIRVYWNPVTTDKLVSGEASGDIGYRWGRIAICPGFLDESDKDREDTIIHELIHILLSPVTNFYDQLISYLDDESEKAKEFISGQLSERAEGVTVDITTALLRSLGETGDGTPPAQPEKPPAKKKKTKTRKRK